MSDDLGKSQIRRLDVKISFDDLKIRRNLSEKIVRFFVRQVAQTQDLADLAGGQKFLELSDTSSASVCDQNIMKVGSGS